MGKSLDISARVGISVALGTIGGLALYQLYAVESPTAWAPAAQFVAAAAAAVAAYGQYRAQKSAEQAGARLTRRVTRLRAILDAAPSIPLITLPEEPSLVMMRLKELFAQPVNRIDALPGVLDKAEAAALTPLLQQLAVKGTAFTHFIRVADGRRLLEVRGQPFIDPVESGINPDLLWLTDVTANHDEAARLTDAATQAEALMRLWQSALEQLPTPIWRRGADLKIIWCNPAFARCAELTPEEVIRSGRDLRSGNAGRQMAEAALQAATTKHEDEHVVIGGARRLLRFVETPIQGLEDGSALIGLAIDMTQLDELKVELGRHLGAHAEVLEQLGSAIAVYGADTRLKFFNQAYVRLWDCDEAWLNTEPTFGEVLEDLRSRRKLPEHANFPNYKRENLALFTGLLEPQESLMHLPDGATLRSLAVAHPFGGVMFILEDVTNTLALESSYNTLMAVQQETLDNLAEGIAVYGEDGRLRLSNPSFASIWKLTPEAVSGEPHVLAIVDSIKGFFGRDEDWPSFREEMAANILDRTARSGRLVRTDGSVVEFSNIPLPDGAVLNSYLDITDSVRVEQALRASNEALETADRMKSEFIANVSYQLRTPLNAIMGFSEILTNQYFGPLNERQLEYSRNVLDSSQSLLVLINDILDLATIEAGYMQLERAEMDVAQMLAGVITLTSDLAHKNNLQLELDCPADIGTIQADEKRLKQALFNLISNAVKFTPAPGTITVLARRDEDDICFAVSDTGIGIPGEDQERVFGRFERANLQTRQTGAGLGLSLVKSFIEMHGGHVDIDSASGEGTRIVCIIPLRESASPANHDGASHTES